MATLSEGSWVSCGTVTKTITVSSTSFHFVAELQGYLSSQDSSGNQSVASFRVLQYVDSNYTSTSNTPYYGYSRSYTFNDGTNSYSKSSTQWPSSHNTGMNTVTTSGGQTLYRYPYDTKTDTQKTMYETSSYTYNHASDGTLSLSVTITGYLYSSSYSGTFTVDFPDIARQSTVTVSPALVTSTNTPLTITLTRSLSTYADIVEITCDANTFSYSTAAGSSATVTETYANLSSGLTTGVSYQITITVDTYTDATYTTQVGSTQTFTATLNTGSLPLSLYHNSTSKKDGLAIGKRATTAELLEVDWAAQFNDNVDITGTVSAKTETVSGVLTRSSGNGAVSSSSIYKFGKVVTLHFTITQSSATSSGSDIFVGSIASGYEPPANVTGATYLGARPLIFSLTSGGVFTVRNAYSGTSGTANFSGSLTYVIA